METSEAVRLSKESDPAGFATLYSQFRPKVLGRCLRLTRNRADAEDLTQDVFLELFQTIQAFDAVRASFETWLYTKTNDAVYGRLRRNSALRRSSQHEPIDTVDSLPVSDHTETRILVDQLLSALSDRQKCFVLDCLDGFTAKESAERFGVSEPAVKFQLHEARQSMRSRLTQ